MRFTAIDTKLFPGKTSGIIWQLKPEGFRGAGKFTSFFNDSDEPLPYKTVIHQEGTSESRVGLTVDMENESITIDIVRPNHESRWHNVRYWPKQEVTQTLKTFLKDSIMVDLVGFFNVPPELVETFYKEMKPAPKITSAPNIQTALNPDAWNQIIDEIHMNSSIISEKLKTTTPKPAVKKVKWRLSAKGLETS